MRHRRCAVLARCFPILLHSPGRRKDSRPVQLESRSVARGVLSDRNRSGVTRQAHSEDPCPDPTDNSVIAVHGTLRGVDRCRGPSESMRAHHETRVRRAVCVCLPGTVRRGPMHLARCDTPDQGGQKRTADRLTSSRDLAHAHSYCSASGSALPPSLLPGALRSPAPGV